jgi:hypothetical protein
LNSRRLQSQTINKLAAFLRYGQKKGNEKQHQCASRQQELASYVLETE